MEKSDQAVHRSSLYTGETGLVYDELLTRHYCAWNSAYTEKPERLKECYKRIKQLGLAEKCVNIPVRPATDKEVRLCHTQKQLDLLKETKTMTVDQLSKLSCSYDYVYFDTYVEENSRLALGGAIDLVEQVVTGKLRNGMAVIRPPGHHAMHEEFSGYCYFNNVAITARTAIERHGLKRILILDWDVHHGQGTQFEFYDDPRVLFFSIHGYERGTEWPHLRESDYDYIGEAAGKGFNVNIPLNQVGCDNSDYLSIFFNLILPVAYEFQPELVLVSAGYDAAIGCPEGQMSVSPACFGHFVSLLTPLAGGKLVLLLEGGYCLRTLAESAALSLRSLLGYPPPYMAPITHPKESVVETVLNVVKVQHHLHPSLAYQDTVSDTDVASPSWQSLSPPQHHQELRTKDNQPSEFPLIQECCDALPHDVEAAIQEEISRLEQVTVLPNPQHRLGLVLYQPDQKDEQKKEASQKQAILYDGELSGCHALNSPSSGSEMVTAVTAIMSDMVQSCVVLPCCAGTLENGGTLYESVLRSGLKKLHSDFHVKRLLFITMTAISQPHVLDSVMQGDHRWLEISLGPSSETDGSHSPPPVNIPLRTSQFKAADVIAAFQQIVLPIAYELGPELVVLCLGPCKSSTEGKDSGETIGMVGHVAAMLQGLAGGRLVLLVTPQAASHHADAVSECIAVLQGRPCRQLSSCLPQQSTVELIKEVQDKEKAEWKTLQYRAKVINPKSV